MKKTLIKVIAIFMAVLILVPVLVSCAGDKETTTAERTKGDEPHRDAKDNLPSDLKFKGDTVVFLYGAEGKNYLDTEGLNMDALNDAIYNRAIDVNERLNIKLNFIADDNCDDALDISIKSTLDEYQLYGDESGTLTVSATRGYFNNFLDEDLNPYVDLEQPWWSNLYQEQATLYGQLYSLSGSLSMSFVQAIACFYYNIDMVKIAGVDNLYKVIKAGNWTTDYFLNLIKGSYVDMTGDGKSNDDTYGFLLDDARTLDTFWSAWDLTCIARDNNGDPELKMDTDKMGIVVDKIRDIIHNNVDVNCLDTMALGEFAGINLNKFANNEGMFMLANVYYTSDPILRNMKSDYGLIPVPKYDDSQDDYYSYNSAFEAYAIPTTVKDVKLSTAALEALAVESYNYVAPAYYNNVLNGRYMRDLESSDMMDLLVANVKLDFGWIYDWCLNKICQNSLRYFIREGQGSFATYWRQNKGIYNKKFSELLSTYSKMADEGGYN